jgi:opacity protein-like surface antigen
MKYLCIAAVAVLLFASAPLKAQYAPAYNQPNSIGWRPRGGPDEPGALYRRNWSRWDGNRSRNDDRDRGWSRRDDRPGYGQESGFWVTVPCWQQVLRCHRWYGRDVWQWEWERGSRREWHPGR